MNLSPKTAAFLLMTFLLIISCRNDSQENPRAYIEGKLVSASVDFNTFYFQIISEGTVVAETLPEPDGNFKLSGPISDGGFIITTTEKIKSFDTGKMGLTLSADALQISVPKGITYIKFNEIVLEK